VGNIENRDFVMRVVRGIDIVFHTAAMKHVILGEKNPDSIIQTNIIGLQNVIDACLINNVERFLFTSSDKAVNPTNAMGTSKLMGERLVTAANSKEKSQSTVLCSTRFGNVIGSKGSVFPLFIDQIKNGGPITLTDRRMTRFVMTIKEAAQLILKACVIARGGEVFVTKMPVIRIEDLAIVMREIIATRLDRSPEDISIIEIGPKPGEKLYEELMSEEEITRSVEMNDFFTILPAFKSVYNKIDYTYTSYGKKVTRQYRSSNEEPLTKQQLKQFLTNNKLLQS
jgi:FlaA1/EpsC-like NDP-sugar epimerase